MNFSRTRVRVFLTLSVFWAATIALAHATAPAITGIRAVGTNCVVTVSVPEGVLRVSLETSDRSVRHRWAPRAVVRPELKAGTATFRLPLSKSLEFIRIRADDTEPLPASFFLGTNAFSSPSDNTFIGAWDANVGPATPGTSNGTGSETAREVVESDIWQVRGDTLFFFNQYRGLQVIDIANPDQAAVRGLLALPSAGEQMYVLSSNRVVLLAREGCNYDQSQVLVVADTNGPPQVVARLPVPGSILESRLVGTALYVASQMSRPVPGTTNTVWEWGTLVSAFDLSDPDAPVTRNTLWYSGYGNVVAATDLFLFVVTQSPVNYYQSVLNLIDVTDPAATIKAYGSITNRGRIPDKFKLHHNGAVLAVISEDRSGATGNGLVTRLETFHLADPRSADPLGIVKLGELELGHGEQLHATRFDGSRVYVVTFFQVDPLWVVDFSNPSAPRIAGSVQVPGWSTYIQPLGDRLLTLGFETNRVTVSLYDVANPAAPTRLSLVTLGSNYSWSEANYDEKAFTVLAEAGLVLVPFSGDTTNGYTSALQLIDYSPTELRARGQVFSASGLAYRRATVFKDRILSLSGWELDSVNATDRDHPLISGRLVLAESVDRVVLANDFLVQVSAGNWWDSSTPVISVAAASTPDRILARHTLPAIPILGVTKGGGETSSANPHYLYLAQGTPGSGINLSNDSTVVLTVLSLTNLPSLTVVSQLFTNTSPLGWSLDWQPLWPRPNVLVWAVNQYNWWFYYLTPVALNGGAAGGPALFWPPYGRQGTGSGHLIAFDATRPEAPALAGQVDLTTTNRYGFSRGFAAAGLIYVSHQLSEFVPDPYPTNSGKWVYRSFLDVVDFADPVDPLTREPVNIPNTLVGVANSGALLFTLGYQWNTDLSTGWRENLEASAYDGVAAHLVDSLPLPSIWPHPVFLLDTTALFGNPGDNNPTNVIPPSLETWALSDAGKFVRLSAATLTSPVSDMACFGKMLAVSDTQSAVSLFDASDPGYLKAAGSGKPPLCWWWPDLARSDGNLAAGLWIPLGAYGVGHIPAD